VIWGEFEWRVRMSERGFRVERENGEEEEGKVKREG